MGYHSAAMNSNKKAVSAIIPAHNESQTICGVIEPLLGHLLIDEIIVVDDGSTDVTAERARFMGVKVISLPNNRGKASAMSRGVRAARNEIVFFCDADIIGLTPETITRIVTAVTSGDYGMYVGIRGRKTYWANRLLHFTPILGGERVLTKTLWNRVPRTYKKNFQVEIALNFFAKLHGQKMGFTVVHGLSQVIKEKKRGFWLGLWQRLLMICDILVVSWRIYVVLHVKLLIGRLLPDRGVMDPAEPLQHSDRQHRASIVQAALHVDE
jgi:glycosyltransferase involved in cell wall biosynthesis